MSTAITPTHWEFLTNTGIFEASEDEGIISITSTATASNYMMYRHPTRMPVGTNVTVSCEMRYLTGDVPKLQVVMDADSQQSPPFTRFYRWAEAKTDNTDWQELRTTETIRSDAQYFTILLGYFQSAQEGTLEVKNIKINVTAGANVTFPGIAEARSYRMTFDSQSISNHFAEFEVGGGTVTESGGMYTLNSPLLADEASLHQDIRHTTRSVLCANSKYGRIVVRGRKLTGNPRIFVDFLADYGNSTVTSSRACSILSSEVVDNEFFFAVPPGTDVVRFSSGFTNFSSGSMELESMSIELYGGEAVTSPTMFFGTLSKDAGTWSLDTGSARFVTLGLELSSVSASQINMTYRGPSTRATFLAENITFSSGDDYWARIGTHITGSFDIRIYDASTNVLVNPSSVADNTFINIIGIGLM